MEMIGLGQVQQKGTLRNYCSKSRTTSYELYVLAYFL